MQYQVNVNYQLNAASEAEAKDKAMEYLTTHVIVTPVKDGIFSPLEVASQCAEFRQSSKEHFCVFFLDTQNKIIGKEIVSTGTLNASLIHPRETFRSAIMQNSCSVIVAHNHPSGGLEPSAEDITVTKRLVEAGKLLGIAVLDHVIVTMDSYTSFKERELI